MVTMVTKQTIFDQLYFCETFKDEPIPNRNFTFLGQGNCEITGGGGGGGESGHWYPMWFQNPWYPKGCSGRQGGELRFLFGKFKACVKTYVDFKL